MLHTNNFQNSGSVYVSKVLNSKNSFPVMFLVVQLYLSEFKCIVEVQIFMQTLQQMVKHHAYLLLYPKLVWLVISSKTIKEQMFINKSEPSKVQPTLQNSSWPCELQNVHLVLANSGKPVRWREELEFLPTEKIHWFVQICFNHIS